MWSAEDSYNKQLEKISHLTYCLNISLMIHEKDLFWYITAYIVNKIPKRALQRAHLSQMWAHIIFSTSDPLLLIVHENDQYWYITVFITNKIPKRCLQMAHLSQMWVRTIFSTSAPLLFIVHENDQYWYIAINMECEILKRAPKTTQLSFNEVKMSR